MDQRKLVGVGNIYACEALFRAKIKPTRIAHKVTKSEAMKLAGAIKQVLSAAIVSGGSTLRDYVRSSGDAGYFQHHFQVYGRAKQPCFVCGKSDPVDTPGRTQHVFLRALPEINSHARVNAHAV